MLFGTVMRQTPAPYRSVCMYSTSYRSTLEGATDHQVNDMLNFDDECVELQDVKRPKIDSCMEDTRSRVREQTPLAAILDYSG